MKLDLTLTSATTYSLTMTPLNGRLLTRMLERLRRSITWVDYRLYDGTSAVQGDYNGDIHVNAADYVIWRQESRRSRAMQTAMSRGANISVPRI